MPNRVDNFNRADSAVSPGTPSDGLGGYSGASLGTWGISGNAAYCATSTLHGVLFMETSMADVTVRATLTVAGSDSGICGRVVDDSNYIVAAANSTTGIKLFKRVAGAFTQLGSTYVTPLADGDVLALRMDGSVLTVSVNGASIITATDAAFSTATKHGLRANTDTAARFDNLSIESTSDTLAPTLTSPTGTSTGTTTASGTVSTNEANGTLYRLASINATELAATVKAAALTQAVSATGSQAASFTGLSAGTTYYAHYVHTDAAGNDSARVSSASFTTAAAAATATTLSGPSGGTVGAASGNFTVGANGAITGTVTVTPSDGGGGGTFSPTSVAISSGTPTATFTYTPASAGAKTISISDTGSLTDATPLTYTATLTAGTLTSSPLKNNTGTVLAAVAFEAYVSSPSTGALVVKKTGLTSNGSGVVSFSDGAVVAATSYRVVWRRTDTGAEGLETLTGT